MIARLSTRDIFSIDDVPMSGNTYRMTTAPVTPKLRHSVAEEIRALLARRQMSGVKLAETIGRSQAYVSRRLNGDTAFDVDDLQMIAEALGVPVTALLPASPEQSLNVRSQPVAERTTPRERRTRARRTPSPIGWQDAATTRPGSSVPPTRRRPSPVRPGDRRMAA